MMDSHNRLVCPHCNKICVRRKVDQGSKYTKKWYLKLIPRRLLFICESCCVEYFTRLDGRLLSAEYEWVANENKYYTITVIHNKEYSEILSHDRIKCPNVTSEVISHDRIKQSNDYVANIVYQVNQKLSITPFNIESKLKTILTFL